MLQGIPTARVRVGVVGLGKMGANHARLYAEMEHAELAGLYDVDRAAAERAAHRFGAYAYASLDDLLSAGLDAVSIAVPTTLHAAVALRAFEAGLHVLVEKPIAATVDEAASLIEAAARAGRRLMVGHVERFNPAVEAVREELSGEPVISINIVRVGPLPPRIKDAGVIIDLGVHDIDIVHHLTRAQAEEVFCVTSCNVATHEDTASILMRMSGGASAQITTNWITPYKARELQVVTAKRLVKANLLTQQVQEFSRFQRADQSYIVRDLYVRQQEPLRAQLQAFLDAVRFDREPPVTGRDGLLALDVAIRAASFRQPALAA